MRRDLLLSLFFSACLLVGILPAHGDTWVWAEKAVDGDTLRLKDGRLVRYMGINAPEIDHASHRADPLGWESQQLNQRLIAGRRIRLEKSPQSKDQYGRILAYIFDEQGRMINQILIAHGLGYYYAHRSNNQMLDEALLSAQHRAMEQHMGIWKKLAASGGPFVANYRSKRFHTRQCRFGISIAANNRVPLTTLWDAFWEGYAPCDRCLPSPIKKELKRR